VDGGHVSGGSYTLGQLIDSYGAEIAADLAEVYRVDLRDVFTTPPHWLLMLIVQLPAGSRFYAARRGGPQFRGWDETRYIMAAVVNSIRVLQWTYIAAHTKRRPPLPEMMPLPDMERKRRDGPGSFAHTAKMKLELARQRKADGG
jgi:hypothetical protein